MVVFVLMNFIIMRFCCFFFFFLFSFCIFFFVLVIMTLIHMKYARWTFLEMSVSCITLEQLCRTITVSKFHKFLFSVALSWDIAVESEFCFCSLCSLVCMASLLQSVLISGTAVGCMVPIENRTETSSFFQEVFTAANFWLLKIGFECAARRRKKFDCNCLTEMEKYPRKVSVHLKTKIPLNR